MAFAYSISPRTQMTVLICRIFAICTSNNSVDPHQHHHHDHHIAFLGGDKLASKRHHPRHAFRKRLCFYAHAHLYIYKIKWNFLKSQLHFNECMYSNQHKITYWLNGLVYTRFAMIGKMNCDLISRQNRKR